MKGIADKVYGILKNVPEGKVTTYKDLAHAIGTNAYRAVGQALKNNPYAPDVPCHRVVASDGTIGGFNGSKSGHDISRKIAMLEKEGVDIIGKKISGFESVRHRFTKH